MLRMSVLALLLSVSAAQAFEPVACTIVDEVGPHETYVIDGKTALTMSHRGPVEYVLTNHRVIGRAHRWMTVLNGHEEGELTLLARKLEWHSGGTSTIRGPCRIATR